MCFGYTFNQNTLVQLFLESQRCPFSPRGFPHPPVYGATNPVPSTPLSCIIDNFPTKLLNYIHVFIFRWNCFSGHRQSGLVCLGMSVPLENWDVTITGEGLKILTYARHSRSLSNKDSLACRTYCKTEETFIVTISEDPWHSYLLLSV